MENFKELLNRPEQHEPLDIQPADCDMMIDFRVPTKEEFCNAIKQLRNGKSAGPETIRAMKAGINTSVEILDSPISQIWKEEKVPSEWKH